ncbi:MAG: alanine racemase [Acidobacteriota bacterium]|nr:alanine racemase [Acidobacteriota bacterium]
MTGGPAPAPEELLGRLAAVRRRIEAAGGDPGAVTVVAVTKGFDAAAVEAALRAGLTDIGENYAEELLAKAARVGPGPVRWHYLGAVQRRKVGRLAPVVACWQGVGRVEEGRSILAHGRAPVFVEVALHDAAHRPGVAPGDVGALVGELQALGLEVRGLMAVGPPGPPEAARPGFRTVVRLARDLGLAEVSAGMSDDLEVAVAEGATMVRLGRALFGARPPGKVRVGTR